MLLSFSLITLIFSNYRSKKALMSYMLSNVTTAQNTLCGFLPLRSLMGHKDVPPYLSISESLTSRFFCPFSIPVSSEKSSICSISSRSEILDQSSPAIRSSYNTDTREGTTCNSFDVSGMQKTQDIQPRWHR